MIDIRYHIYSLAAIFMALAIGIVIGASFVKGTSPDNAGRRTIQRYENDMGVLKSEILNATQTATEKETYAKNCQDFCSAVMPGLIKNKLAWRNVAIIQTGDYDSISGSIQRALELAGARVTSVTDISRTFDFADEDKISQALISCGITPPANSKEARDKLFSVIANSLHLGQHPDLLPKLEQAGIANFTKDYQKVNKMVVLVGGASADDKNAAQNVDAQLISQLDKLGVIVVGCENMDAVSSYIPTWHKLGIATIDNADTAMGQIALIYALNGENANFGIKKTADRFIPQTLETK